MNSQHSTGCVNEDAPATAISSRGAPSTRHVATAAQVTLPDPIDVMGLPIRPLWMDQLVELLVARARDGVRTCVTYANAQTVNLAWSDASFRRVLRGMDVLYAEGLSVLLAGRLTGSDLPERMPATDYSEWFASRCADEGVSLFLLGGAPGVADDAAAALRAGCPELTIAGTHHGEFEDDDSAQVVDAVNHSGANALLVGMPSPRQEAWVAQHADALKVPMIWCVGALLDHHAGCELRGPDWLCRHGGEWLGRLWAQPRETSRRALVGHPLFAWRALAWGWHHRQAVRARIERERADGD